MLYIRFLFYGKKKEAVSGFFVFILYTPSWCVFTKVFFVAGFQVISGIYVWQASWLQEKIWQPIEVSVLQRCLFYVSSFKSCCLMGLLTTLQLTLFWKIKLIILYNWIQPILWFFSLEKDQNFCKNVFSIVI